MGDAKLSARPRHRQQDPAALTAFKRTSPPRERDRAPLPADTPLELWWQDEARVGRKNTAPRRWARKGSRPTAPKDQRTASAYIFGAICLCPEKGKGAGLVLPRCATPAMNAHLAEISRAVDPGAYAVVILDGAG